MKPPIQEDERVTIFAPGDDFDGRRGVVVKTLDVRQVVVSFGGSLAFVFRNNELRRGW